MADDEYIIKTKYADSIDFVYVKKSELSFENYCLNGKIQLFYPAQDFLKLVFDRFAIYRS